MCDTRPPQLFPAAPRICLSNTCGIKLGIQIRLLQLSLTMYRTTAATAWVTKNRVEYSKSVIKKEDLQLLMTWHSLPQMNIVHFIYMSQVSCALVVKITSNIGFNVLM